MRMTSGARSATRLAAAVAGWLETLDPGQRAQATFPFESAERFAWDYRPGDRGGLALGEMTAIQRDAALAILDTGLSDRGAREVRAIMALEPILGELERRDGRANWSRDSDLYWFAAFGDPDGSDKPDGSSPWSWRVGGHHVAIQVTVADGRVIGSAPSFLGSNPATVPYGPLAGQRAIDGEETLARALLGSLTPAQLQISVVDPVAPPDILSGIGRRADIREVPVGIRYDQLETEQREGMERLIRHYLDRFDSDIAEGDWDLISGMDMATMTFAWAGSDLPARGHYYAIRGPTFLIEYDNTQNGANHIHAVRRDLTNDWGEDLLAAHYAAKHITG